MFWGLKASPVAWKSFMEATRLNSNEFDKSETLCEG